MTIATAAPNPPSPAAIEFALPQSWLASSATLQLPLHAIEAQQSDKGREVLRLLLPAHLQRGDGDVGTALLVQSGHQQLLYAHRRLGTRSLTTVFGAVEVTCMGYSRPGTPSLFPLDRALSLPGRSFSYDSSADWSRPPCRTRSWRRWRPSPNSQACPFPNAAWSRFCPT